MRGTSFMAPRGELGKQDSNRMCFFFLHTYNINVLFKIRNGKIRLLISETLGTNDIRKMEDFSISL